MLNLGLNLYINSSRNVHLTHRPPLANRTSPGVTALMASGLPATSAPTMALTPKRFITTTLDHRLLTQSKKENFDPRECWRSNKTPFDAFPSLIRRVLIVRAVMTRMGLIPFVHSYPAHLDPVYQFMSHFLLGSCPSKSHRRVMRAHPIDHRMVNKEMSMVYALLSAKEINDHHDLARQHLISANPHILGTEKGETAMYYGLRNRVASKDPTSAINAGQFALNLFLTSLGLSSNEIQELGVLDSIGSIQKRALKESNSVCTVIGVEPDKADTVAYDSHAYGHPTSKSLHEALVVADLQKALKLQARIWTSRIPGLMCVAASNPIEYDEFLRKHSLSFVDPADLGLYREYFGIGGKKSDVEAENEKRMRDRLQQQAEVIPALVQKTQDAIQSQ